jgi:asparagine N-glycosylation enzyme membrane subunit Stt3
MEETNFIQDITNWLSKNIPMATIVAISAGIQVFIRNTNSEVKMTNRRKLTLFILSFGIGMLILVIGQGMFGYYGGGAAAICGALVGEKLVTWVIVNQEVIMEQIAKRFKINVKK